MATYSARDIAADLRRRLPGVPAKKLHKLLYYAQGHHLATFGEPLFKESISAWDMGPVVGQLWYAETQDGPAEMVDELAEAALNTVGYVVSRYGRLNGGELERLTHGEAPWIEADVARRETRSRTQRIEPEAIRAYFAAAPDAEDDSVIPLDPHQVDVWLEDSEPRHERSWDSAESLLARLQ